MKKLIYISLLLPLMALANATIDSMVWNDLNQDWTQNSNEKGLPNVAVELYSHINGVKKKVKTTRTDTNGRYKFKNFKDGEYIVKVIPDANSIVVTENNLELWLETNRKDLNFGLYKKKGTSKPITKAKLV